VDEKRDIARRWEEIRSDRWGKKRMIKGREG